MLTAGVEAV